VLSSPSTILNTFIGINDRDSESMDSVDGKHDFITIPNDRDSESMDYKYS